MTSLPRGTQWHSFFAQSSLLCWSSNNRGFDVNRLQSRHTNSWPWCTCLSSNVCSPTLKLGNIDSPFYWRPQKKLRFLQGAILGLRAPVMQRAEVELLGRCCLLEFAPICVGNCAPPLTSCISAFRWSIIGTRVSVRWIKALGNSGIRSCSVKLVFSDQRDSSGRKAELYSPHWTCWACRKVITVTSQTLLVGCAHYHNWHRLLSTL